MIRSFELTSACRAEYFARYNLGNDVPFELYTNGIVSFDVISEASRGAVRPAWELLYSHYVNIKGLDAPWTKAYLNHSLEFFGGFEGGAGSWGEGSGHYDGLGWGSLLHHLDESDIQAAQPSDASPEPTTTTSESQPRSTSLATVRNASGSKTATADEGAETATVKPSAISAHRSSTTIATAIPQVTEEPGKGCRARRPKSRKHKGRKHHSVLN